MPTYTYSKTGRRNEVKVRPNLAAATTPEINRARPTRSLSGSGVTVTNPTFTDRSATRTGGIGAGADRPGQRGRFMDV